MSALLISWCIFGFIAGLPASQSRSREDALGRPWVVDQRAAKDFLHHRVRRDNLWEECYGESCDREEVEEGGLSGHALDHYYNAARCRRTYGSSYTYNSQTGNCEYLSGLQICDSSKGVYRVDIGTRQCSFGGLKVITAIYMENGCYDGEVASWRLKFNDPAESIRDVSDVGCRERKAIQEVAGASSFEAIMNGGGGGDGIVGSDSLGWFGRDVECGGTLSADQGEIQSYLFPDKYPNSLTCTWTIFGSHQSAFTLTFTDFELEGHPECAFDYLEIHDGQGRSVDKLCGAGLPSQKLIPGLQMTLTFHSDSSNVYRGFKLRFAQCGGEVHEASGYVTSLRYPNSYPSNCNCVWKITAPDGYALRLTFEEFELESHSNCQYDSLEIYNGLNQNQNQLAAKRCGSGLPGQIMSTGRELLLRFRTDHSAEYRGFKLHYQRVGQCAAGHYSSTGYGPCTSCAVGSYQDSPRQRSCTQCPSGKSTHSSGSRYSSDCHYRCREAICNLQEWTPWGATAQPVSGHCASESRRRVYTKTWREILEPSGCHNVRTTCPDDVENFREKILYCPKLSVPKFGYFVPSSCASQQQPCKTACTLYCNSGFERQGSPDQAKPVCQANRQWTSLDSYCKDVTSPSITCPEDLTVENDPGKPAARVTLPRPTASDNTGEAPTITISPPDVGATHEFHIGNSTVITYVATDAAGWKTSCSFSVKVKDTEQPEVLSCPTKVTQFGSKNPARIVWEPPTFKDNFDPYPKIASIIKPGTALRWGRHKNVYTATDKAGNKATCKFEIEYGPLKCRVYDAPLNGARACNIKTDGIEQELACTVMCNEKAGFVPPPQWDSYLCQSDGNWYGLKQNTFVPLQLPEGKPWPDCARKSPPTSVAKKVTLYAGKCSSHKGEEQIKKNFLAAIKSDFLLMDMLCGRGGGVDCQVANVKVYCGQTNPLRRKRDSQDDNLVITFEIAVEILHPESNGTAQKAKLQEMANDLDGRSSDIDRAAKQVAAALHISPDQVRVKQGDALVTCLAGTIPVAKPGNGSDILRIDCVNCVAGTFYDTATQTCADCPLGTYQDEEAQQSCKKCPSGTITMATRTRDLDECRGICGPGKYSATGLETCTSCPFGSYQNNTRSRSCAKCPLGTTTSQTAATSAQECKPYCDPTAKQNSDGSSSDAVGVSGQSDCIDVCPPGRYSATGVQNCSPCAVGSYQSNNQSIACVRCPNGTSTLRTGSTSAQECKRYCRPGLFAPGGLGACVPCPRGSYQPLLRGTSCITCPDGKTTLRNGSSSPSQCTTPTCSSPWKTHGDHCYRLMDQAKGKWTDARETCRALGAELPVINSQEENDFILGVARAASQVPLRRLWLGLRRIGESRTFSVWVDDTHISDFRNWASGEPNDSGGEDCAEMIVNGGSRGKWNDIDCTPSVMHSVMCEKAL